MIKGQKACGRRDGGTLTSVTQFEEKKVTLSLRVQAFALRGPAPLEGRFVRRATERCVLTLERSKRCPMNAQLKL